MIDLRKITEGKSLTETEELVLVYMVEHMDTVLKMGVRGVARENYTSSSTIMRLTKKLGYKGFVDMYYKLLPMISSTQQSTMSQTQFIHNFCSNSLLQYNSYDDMRRFALQVCELKDKFIFVYATGFSSMAAEYFTKKFLVLGRKCIYSNGMDSIGIFENNIDDMGMLIVVSRSGETKPVVERMKTAKENGIFAVSFTNEGENRVSALSDIPFRIEDSNKLDDRNMMANVFFPNVLMLMELLIYEYHKVMQTD